MLNPMQHRFTLAISCFVVFIGSASAQSEAFTGSVTSTDTVEPALEQERQSELWQQRHERAEGFRTKMLSTRRGVELFEDYQQAYGRNRLEHATACRLSKRKANKNGRFAVVARCYRTALLMEREFWQKHINQVEGLPGIQPEYRDTAVISLKGMIDAIDSIILGIDSDVYNDEEGLVEAKRNLHQKYRATVSLDLSKIRANRTLTWISHFMSRMMRLLETEEVNEATFAKLQEALYCLELGELYMEEILLEESYKQANLILSQSLRHLLTCSEYLEDGYELHNPKPNNASL